MKKFTTKSQKNFDYSKSSLQYFDPEFVKKMYWIFWPLEKYFRFEVRGLNNIPKKGPVFVVMNHGIIPYHGFMFAKKLVSDLKVYPRGLGADFLFDIPYVREFFLKGGAVRARPRNAVQLLKDGHLVMLSPGGIYEALIAKKGLRRIPWERRKGFVKIAVQAKTPIVPTYCQGINSVYWNSYFLLKPRIKLFEKTRFGVPLFLGLGLLPFPRKLIHRVGKPIKTTKRRGETLTQQIDRVHGEVINAMTGLAKRKER